jgi:glycogen(starch) synthase
MVEAQKRHGLTCAVASFDNFRHKASGKAEPDSSTSATGIHTIRLETRDAISQASELCQEFAPDVVHVHSETLWDFAAKLCKPTAYTVHVLQSEQDRLRGIAATQSTQNQHRALSECGAIHAPSAAVAKLLVKSGIAAKRIHTIPLATADWPQSEEAYECDRFAESSQRLLLYAGRFADINGFAEFLEAVPVVLQRHPELQVIAAGGVPGNARGERRWRKRWQEMSGALHDRLVMRGWLTKSELSKLYAQATVLVVPSWFETFGQVVLEGMLHGAPLVTTGAGAIAELVDEDSALLIPARDSVAIADAVDLVLSDPEAANQRRALGRARAQRFAWDDRVPLLRALYEQLSPVERPETHP